MRPGPLSVLAYFLQKTLSRSPGVYLSIFSPQWQESNRRPFGAGAPKAAPSLWPPWEQSWGPGWLSSHRGLEWSEWGTGLGDFSPQLRCGGGRGGGPEKLHEVTGTSRGNPGFSAMTREKPRESFFTRLEARFPYHDWRKMTRSPSPRA